MLHPTWPETALAVGIGVAAILTAMTAYPGSFLGGLSRIILAAWIGFYAVVFGAAPLLGLVARRGPPRSAGPDPHRPVVGPSHGTP